MDIRAIFDKLPAQTRKALTAVEKYLGSMSGRPESVAVFDEDYRAISEAANKGRKEGSPAITEFRFCGVRLRRHEKRYKSASKR